MASDRDSSPGAGDATPDDLGHAKTETPETAVPPMRARPEVDGLARAVARARVASKLFAKTEQVHLGRYHLLEQVGAGGMGVVWGAWDPELERRVAIKLVKATLASARDRILLEGQALAKLSHPNVVTVYDVGVVRNLALPDEPAALADRDDQVYIVMEWVRGQNLRAWGRTPRSVHDIVAIYRAAGDGLAAAHAAGLIHRDFKPDNAILGEDGRVRVLDFGLARNDVRASDDGAVTPRTPSSDATRGAGTPRYMPPEQAAGGELTPAVDQYAFCVSLREQLAARNADDRAADIPRWLEAIAIRGTAREPGDRFPSMAELLRALARDPATIWRRRLLVGGAVAATAAAFVIGNLRAASDAIEPCSGAATEIATTLSPDARARMLGHLGDLGAYGRDEAARVDSELASYAAQWASSHRAACLAHERGELTPQLYERGLACLGRARASLGAAVDLLGTVPADRLSNAIVASRSLPSTDSCLRQTFASTVEPPPPAIAPRVTALANQLAGLRVLAQAADPTAAATAAALVAQAEQLHYLPLLARAYLVQGLDLVTRRDTAKAVDAFDRAAASALDTGDEPVFIEAYARQIFGIVTTSKGQWSESVRATLGAIPYVARIAGRLGPAAAFERALLFNNIGVARLAAGDATSARSWFVRAIDEPATSNGNVELVAALGNLALATDDAAERDRLSTREQETLSSLLGPNHIVTLEARFKGAMLRSEPSTLFAQLRDICHRANTFHAIEGKDFVSRCAYDLGWIAEERGELAESRWAMQLVAGSLTLKTRAPIARAYLAAFDGHLEEAASQAKLAAAGLQGEWWTKVFASDAYLFAALCAEQRGAAAQALVDAQRARELLDQLDLIKQKQFYLRRLARVRALLARLVARTDPARARSFAMEAADWYRVAGGYDGALRVLAPLLIP